MTILAPMLKNRVFITVLILLVTNNALGQTDSLKVYLEKNKEHKCGIDLVFENSYRDTVFLMTKFKNYTFKREMPMYPGVIELQFFNNDNIITADWGDNPIQSFDFFDGFKFIPPNSKVKLFFNICDYYYFPDDRYTLKVGVMINYIYWIYKRDTPPNSIFYFQTNRVNLFEPPKEDTENDNPCPDAEK